MSFLCFEAYFEVALKFYESDDNTYATVASHRSLKNQFGVLINSVPVGLKF